MHFIEQFIDKNLIHMRESNEIFYDFSCLVIMIHGVLPF